MKLSPRMSAHRSRRAPAQASRLLLLCLALSGLGAASLSQAAPTLSATQTAGNFWQDVRVSGKVSLKGAQAEIQAREFRAVTLDKSGFASLLRNAPMERTAAASLAPLEISLPHPDGGYQRFAISESPVMAPELAAKHPEIKTFAGRGIDDPSVTLRMDITPLGAHASVRSPQGGWYIDPYYKGEDSVYAVYHRRALANVHGAALTEPAHTEAQLQLNRGFFHAGDSVELRGSGFTPGATVSISVHAADESVARQTLSTVADADGNISLSVPADPSGGLGAFEISASDGMISTSLPYHVVSDDLQPAASVGSQLRTYRLALLTDPSYATYFGGSANVTAAKVTLINRVTQVYEDETSIRLQLIGNNDVLNLDTAAQMTGANGPCGGAACFSTSQAGSCTSGTLTRNRVVVGLLAGASNFDIGHIALGNTGGGLASLGVVGGNNKAQGCTGVPTPVGDYFAVDYVAHEMGHQFAGNHTFNGVTGSCTGGNRNAGTSVEPGSGTSVMAYAGICSTDDLQPHSDPYWSQRSFDEIVAYTSSAETTINEVQMGVLSGFSANGLSFKLSYKGAKSAAIVRGTNFTTTGIKAAIEGISGWPAGGTVSVSSLSDNAFTITFGGTLAGVNVDQLGISDLSAGVSGKLGEIASGGKSTRGGNAGASANHAPVVSVASGYTIPVRTPFALTGSASDADGDTLTYMWEQNDRGAGTGTALLTNTKLDGPLFRQFGTRAVVPDSDSKLYNSPGENHTTTDPTRVFPDLTQILANNTNAETGSCPTASSPATAAQIDCYSEFLPTAAYVGFGSNASPAALNFRLTARDGRGGVASADTRLVLAPNAGPFLVTAPNSAVTLDAGSTQTISWAVANTNVAPVSTSDVKISLSLDGGKTWPHVLAPSTPNNGSATVSLPLVASSTARVKVEAINNVFFDVSNANFTIRLQGDLNGDGQLSCDDLALVKAAMGKRRGQPGYDSRADLNSDGVIDIRDLSAEAQKLPRSLGCK